MTPAKKKEPTSSTKRKTPATAPVPPPTKRQAVPPPPKKLPSSDGSSTSSEGEDAAAPKPVARLPTAPIAAPVPKRKTAAATELTRIAADLQGEPPPPRDAAAPPPPEAPWSHPHPRPAVAGLLGNDAEALEELSLTTSCRPAQIAAPSEPGSSDAVGDLELDDPLALLTEVVHTADSPGASFEPSGWVDLKKARVPTPPGTGAWPKQPKASGVAERTRNRGERRPVVTEQKVRPPPLLPPRSSLPSRALSLPLRRPPPLTLLPSPRQSDDDTATLSMPSPPHPSEADAFAPAAAGELDPLYLSDEEVPLLHFRFDDAVPKERKPPSQPRERKPPAKTEELDSCLELLKSQQKQQAAAAAPLAPTAALPRPASRQPAAAAPAPAGSAGDAGEITPGAAGAGMKPPAALAKPPASAAKAPKAGGAREPPKAAAAPAPSAARPLRFSAWEPGKGFVERTNSKGIEKALTKAQPASAAPAAAAKKAAPASPKAENRNPAANIEPPKPIGEQIVFSWSHTTIAGAK